MPAPRRKACPDLENVHGNPSEIERLLRRLAAVLRADGEELLADNILLQSSRLAETSQGLLDRQRGLQAMAVVERYGWIGAGVIGDPTAGR